MSLIDALLDEEVIRTPPKEVFIAIRTDGTTGTGAIYDPYNGSTQTLLDNLLRDVITADMTVYFGPGVFQTAGNGGLNSVWTVLNRQRFVGAGMFQTTLQVVQAVPTTPVAPIFAFGSAVERDGVEISDMTICANLSRQPLSGGVKNDKLTVGGISLSGTNIKIRRVRIINWGTYNKDKEGFPIFLTGFATTGGGETGENIVEDCVLEQPDLSPGREITILNNHADPHYQKIFCTVRNNYINGDFTTGSPPPGVPGMSFAETDSGTKLTLKTQWPHRLQSGDELLVSGSPASALNRRYDASNDQLQILDDYTLKFNKPSYSGSAFGPDLKAQRYVPQAMAVTLSVVVTGSGPYNATVTITTPVPHLRRAGTGAVTADTIRVSGVLTGGSADNLFNGSFVVTSIPSSTTLQYQFTSDSSIPTPDGGALIWLDRWPSQMVVIKSNGLSNAGTTGTVETVGPHFKAKDDHVLITDLTGSVGWNGWFKVLELVNSRIIKVQLTTPSPAAPIYGTAQLPQTFQGITATTGYGARVYGNRLVDLRRGGPYHDLTEGFSRRTKDLFTYENYYYFVFVGQFSAIAESDLPNNVDNREGRNITSDNIIELQPYAVGTSAQGTPGGILFWAPAPPKVTNMPEIETLIIRDNIIRFFGGAPAGGAPNQYGISVVSTQDVIVEDNLLAFPAANQPLDITNSVSLKYFNNLGPNGIVLQGYDKTNLHYTQEIQTLADDMIWVSTSRQFHP